MQDSTPLHGNIQGMTERVFGPLPDPREEPTITVEHAGHLLGISRPSAYDAAARGDIPTIRMGRRLLVPTAAMWRMLQLEHAGKTGDAA